MILEYLISVVLCRQGKGYCKVYRFLWLIRRYQNLAGRENEIADLVEGSYERYLEKHAHRALDDRAQTHIQVVFPVDSLVHRRHVSDVGGKIRAVLLCACLCNVLVLHIL